MFEKQSESPAGNALVLQSGEFGELERRATVVLASTGTHPTSFRLLARIDARTCPYLDSLGAFEWVALARI